MTTAWDAVIGDNVLRDKAYAIIERKAQEFVDSSQELSQNPDSRKAYLSMARDNFSWNPSMTDGSGKNQHEVVRAKKGVMKNAARVLDVLEEALDMHPTTAHIDHQVEPIDSSIYAGMLKRYADKIKYMPRDKIPEFTLSLAQLKKAAAEGETIVGIDSRFNDTGYRETIYFWHAVSDPKVSSVLQGIDIKYDETGGVKVTYSTNRLVSETHDLMVTRSFGASNDDVGSKVDIENNKESDQSKRTLNATRGRYVSLELQGKKVSGESYETFVINVFPKPTAINSNPTG